MNGGIAPPGRNIAAGSRGFTLLELLVAFLLLGMLAGVLAGSLSFGRRAWEVGESRLTETGDVRLVQAFLRRTIGESYPTAMSDESPVIDFQGHPASLTFVSAMDLASGFRRVSIATRADSPREVVFTQTAARGPDAARPTVLVDGVRELDFAYFGALEGEEKRWHARWTNAERLPSLVRVRIAFDDQRRQWPELVVAPAIAGDPACYVDAALQRCRGR